MPRFYFTPGSNTFRSGTSLNTPCCGGGGGGSVDLTSVNTNIIPTESGSFDLGSAAKTFKNVYIKDNVVISSSKIFVDGNGALKITAPGGTTKFIVTNSSGNSTTTPWIVSGDNIFRLTGQVHIKDASINDLSVYTS